jgi:hypothetical protein
VQGFLGTCGLVQIFIKDFAKHACPLVNLMCKDIMFEFGALNWLSKQYGIHHIHISPYNSQANRIVEHHYLDIQEAIMKVCDGEKRIWPTATHAVFWVE